MARARAGIRRALRDAPVRPAVALAALLSLAAASAIHAESLPARVDRLLAKGALAQASVGVLVARADDGTVVYARGADQLFIPASNQKILTVLASLERFGPTHRFATRIWAPEPVDGEGLVRELVVEGGGDPAMGSEDWWRVAADLRHAGLRGVEGDLRVDDRLFAGPAWHPSWGDLTARAYHAPIGALTANFGAFAVSVWPRAAAGSAARVAVDPPVEYLRLRNLARTVPRRAHPELVVDRVAGASSEGLAEEIVRVEGSVRRGDPGDLFPRSVLDPGLYAGSLLLHQMRANGIGVEGVVRRAPREGDGFALILERRGRSLAEIARLCLKSSSNAVAETLVKDLGAWAGVDAAGPPSASGDWAGGIRALRETLEARGLDLENARLVDGSGLSIQNRLSPRMLVDALALASRSFRTGPELVAALPIGGRDGTLERRLEGTDGRIRAKTGLLSDAGVTALSGYAERRDGTGLIFSILVNGRGGGTEAAMEAVDDLARALLEAELPAKPTESASPPDPAAPADPSEAVEPSGASTAVPAEPLRSPDQEGRVTPAGSRTKARITESMYSEGSVSPSRSRRSMTPGPQL